MNSSKYLKSPQEFYDELAACIKENDSHKVLSVMLRMGISGANINDIVSGAGLDAEPLYLKAIGQDEAILQHMQEFGVVIPESVPVTQLEIPTPKGLKSNRNRMFAQHFVFRRTREGKEIFNYAPACKGFCYEYVSFHMRPHKNTHEDFLDKLLRELYEHSTDFYQRIKGYQDFAGSRFEGQSDITGFDYNSANILDAYTDELKEAEFVLFNLQFQNMAHCVVIHKIETEQGKRYQLFDPTAFDAKWLTAEELNERFRQQMRNYHEAWEWGEPLIFYFSDIAPNLKKMGHLQTHQNKHPFKNIHQLKKGLKNQDIDSIRKFLENSVMSAEAIHSNYNVSERIFSYLIDNDDATFIKKILDTLSPNNLLVMTNEIMMSRRKSKAGIAILDWVMESTHAASLPDQLVNQILGVQAFNHALENKEINIIENLIQKYELNMNEMSPYYTTYSISSMLFTYLNEGSELAIKKKIMETVSEKDFGELVNKILLLANNMELLELIKINKNYTILPEETANQVERMYSLKKSLMENDIDSIKTHLKDYKMSKEDNDINNSNTNIIFLQLLYDKSNFRTTLLDALSDDNFITMANLGNATWLLMGKEKNELLKLFYESGRFERIPEETANKIRIKLGVEKPVQINRLSL